MGPNNRVRSLYTDVQQTIVREAGVFLSAWLCFTRIPVGASLIERARKRDEAIYTSARYAPLVGLLIGLAAGVVFLAVATLFDSKGIGVIAGILASILMTGAIHEDGTAHFVEAFWTTNTPRDDILRRLKEPWIGVPGTLSLIFIIGSMYMALIHLGYWVIPVAFIVAHAFARFAAITLIFSSRRADSSESTTPVLPTASFLFMAAFGMLPLLFFGNILFLFLVPLLWIIRALIGAWSNKRVGGWTADTISAVILITILTAFLLLTIAEAHAFSI